MKFLDWCIKAHADTNHYYDQYLPYEFHLRMTMQAAVDFKHILGDHDRMDIEFRMILAVCAGHDVIEDTRKTYNDVLMALRTCDEAWDEGKSIAIVEAIYAVTNEKGKNRAERANAKYYRGIRGTYMAKFVKMCDRIANVRYSVLTKSKQLQMHKKEHEHFLDEMGLEPMYQPMVDHLNELLNRHP